MNFDLKSFTGVLRTDRNLTVPILGEANRIPEAFERWDRWMTPIDDQGKRGTCVAQATSRIIEWAIWYFMGQRVQLDAERLYRVAWTLQNKKEWPGDIAYQDGLQMQAAYHAAIQEGLLGGASYMVNVPMTSIDIFDALAHGPLLAGTCVTRAWQNPQPDTGEILRANVEMNGHAWTMHGMGKSNEPDGGALVRGCNSWGTGWGYHGFFQIHVPHYIQCALCSPISIRDDWNRTLITRKWEGWVLP